MDTIDKMKEQIATIGQQRVEIEAVLVKNRENVIVWLESVSDACLRERWELIDNGNIADGEIQVPWNLLQEAIAQLRETQHLMRRNSEMRQECQAELDDAGFPMR